MIFISLGSQKFQFNRLLKYVDTLIHQGVIKEPVFAQIGYSTYKPISYSYTDFLTRNEYVSKIKNSTYIITHSGTGAIVTSLKMGKKIIVVPRLNNYGEHVDNHQIEIANSFYSANLVLTAQDFESLRESILIIEKWMPASFQGNNDAYINFVLKILEE